VTQEEFTNRFEQEQIAFLKLCSQVGVWQEVQNIEPILAPAFAEELILCLDMDAARRKIEADRAGAAGFVEWAQFLADDEQRKTWLLSGVTMPTENLAPFYLVCAVVIDAARKYQHILHHYKEGWSEPPVT
jgi:hypothetical protein